MCITRVGKVRKELFLQQQQQQKQKQKLEKHVKMPRGFEFQAIWTHELVLCWAYTHSPKPHKHNWPRVLLIKPIKRVLYDCQISNVLVLYFYLWNFQRSGSSKGMFGLLVTITNECDKLFGQVLWHKIT